MSRDFKEIKFSDGTSIMMNVEMVLKQFYPMSIKFAKTCNQAKNQINDFDDYVQIGLIALAEAFNNYNEECCFTTYATYKFKQKYSSLKQNADVKKRSESKKYEFININSKFEDGKELADIIGIEDRNILKITTQNGFLGYAEMFLTEYEVELMMYLANQEQTIQQIATKNNLSRVSVHKHLNKLKTKLMKLHTKYINL